MAEYLHFEDLEVGAIWSSPSRTITEADVIFFAGMTGDYDPLHMDHEYASQISLRPSHCPRLARHVDYGGSQQYGPSHAQPGVYKDRKLGISSTNICRRYAACGNCGRVADGARTPQRGSRLVAPIDEF